MVDPHQIGFEIIYKQHILQLGHAWNIQNPFTKYLTFLPITQGHYSNKTIFQVSEVELVTCHMSWTTTVKIPNSINSGLQGTMSNNQTFSLFLLPYSFYTFSVPVPRGVSIALGTEFLHLKSCSILKQYGLIWLRAPQ